jgi:hypothetical protein
MITIEDKLAQARARQALVRKHTQLGMFFNKLIPLCEWDSYLDSISEKKQSDDQPLG